MIAKSFLRWLLEIDKPVPVRTDQEVQEEMERNFRWNSAVNFLDGASFWFGLSFISSTTILPLFVSKITDSPFAIGLVAMIAQGAWFLPQLFTANFVERLARKKPVIVNLGFFTERLPLWFMVLSAVIALKWPILALLLFITSYAFHGFGAGLVATAWQDMLARCFPVARRGRFMGITMFVGAAMGTASASLSARMLESYPFPRNFVIVFFIAALSITISWGFLALTREPVQQVTAPRRSNRQFFAELPAVVRQDENFRRFLIGRMLLALGGMGSGFVTVSAVSRWHVADSVVAFYTVAFLLGQTIGNLVFGFLADKLGHKLSLELSGLASFLSFAIAWLAPSPEWYYLVFFLSGITVGGIIVSGILVVLEFSRPEKRPTYTGLANTGAGVVGTVSPLLGAWLANSGYDWLFAFAALTSFLSFVVLRWWVVEPRKVAPSPQPLSRI